MEIVDTHSHLYLESFDDDREQVIRNAINLGVNHFFIPAIDSRYYNRMIELKTAFPKNIYLMAGLHPCYVNEKYKQELKYLEDFLKSENDFYAIGEIGIDLYRHNKNLDIQEKVFKYQINIAKENNLPVVIHCRDAFDEVYEILKSNFDDNLNGIFHCFTGTLDQAKKIIDLNFKIGIGGVVTFKNGKIDKFLKEIPIKNIVLETDSPYLSPTPLRGKRNESYNLIYIINKLSEIYGLSSKEICKQTTFNAKQVFKIL